MSSNLQSPSSRGRFSRRLVGLSLASLACLQVAGCGGSPPTPQTTPMAQQSALAVVSSVQGVTPFIQIVALDGRGIGDVRSLAFTVQPKAGSLSKAVSARYTRDYLARRGYAPAGGPSVTLPVFGLYADFANQVKIEVGFADGSSTVIPLEIATAAYTDPSGNYAAQKILTPRAADAVLGFDFFFIKSALGTPVVVDTDGQMRWVGAEKSNSRASTFSDNAFIIGGQASLELRRQELDGTFTTTAVSAPDCTNFHHTVDPGKVGLLGEFDATINGQKVMESVLAEFSPTGAVLGEWNVETLLARYMASQGDDPALFVRGGSDWFHMNGAMYDARDDSVVVSSRENFVIKLDYRTGDVVWVLGDPTKYWHTFASLRAKSLALEEGGLYPIGQHTLSLTPDGLLLMLNNGAPSYNNPPNTPAGESRSYSAVSAYAIDTAARTAREAWHFDYGKTIQSEICGSAYQTADGSTLIDYATASNRTKARLVGLDRERRVVFDYEYPSPQPCLTSWNAEPIAFEALSFK